MFLPDRRHVYRGLDAVRSLKASANRGPFWATNGASFSITASLTGSSGTRYRDRKDKKRKKRERKIGNQKNVITFPLGFPNPNAVDRHINIDKCKSPISKDYRR
jgi:hypothetical protein